MNGIRNVCKQPYGHGINACRPRVFIVSLSVSGVRTWALSRCEVYIMATAFARGAAKAAATVRPIVPRLGFIGLGNMGLQMAQNLFLKATVASTVSAASSPTNSVPGRSTVRPARRQFVVCDPNPDNVLSLVNFVSKNIDGAEVLVVDTPLEYVFLRSARSRC